MMGRCSRLQAPALLVFSRHDPILPRAPIERQLRNLPSNIDVCWLAAGGHVHFPASASLGEEAAPGIESQCIAWLIRNSSSAHEFEKAV
jgi:predicted alpha/beta-fold hydrolase